MTFEWGKIVRSINWTLVFNLINFGILLYLLKRLLFKPALDYLDRRREQISARMVAAREDQEQAARLVEERRRALDAARRKAQGILDEAVARSEEIVVEARKAAKTEAERIVEGARIQMEQDLDRMIHELRESYAEIAVAGAARVLDREVKIDDHHRLLEQLLAEIDEGALKVNP